MKPLEEKGCIYGSTEEVSSNNAANFEFHKGNRMNRGSHHRMALGKPTPSKWDDAQKWLVGFSRGGEKNHSKTKPRNSNADDRSLIAAVPQKEKDSSSSSGDEGREDGRTMIQDEGETKNVDSNQTIWRINRASEDAAAAIRSICVRDMGTEMTPIASQEPSRTGTPMRDMTPAARSPISSRSSTPERCQQGVQSVESYQTGLTSFDNRTEVMGFGREGGATRWPNRVEEEPHTFKPYENKNVEQARKPNPLETRAMAWDEAERAKYMARCKREEVKIQAWENHEKRKAEMEMRRMEVKAERLKSRAQEKLANKLAATRRIAEEKRANAEAKLNEQAARTAERADYMRRTGHLPSSFSFKLPSLCW
ncbi:Remorin [Macleaya cordata]|uniref:Remorin n=1 Tax=Macleaya cordata TaxID=56857 RepID=A0A200QY51_MACCD|nr:Remorin [Macleaya cordata]